MSGRTAARLAWSSFGVTAALLAAETALSFGREPVFDTLIYGLLTISLATVGALVASRHPGNAIGWLFCGLGVFEAIAGSVGGWGYLAAERGLPGSELGEWIVLWSWIGSLTAWIVVFLLFPDGRLPARRWRIVAWISIAGCALALPGQALTPDIGAEFVSGTNPFAVEGMPTELLYGAGVSLLVTASSAATASLVVRFRRAGSVERQQLKWFALAAGFLVVTLPFAAAFYFESVLVQVVVAFAINGLPIAVGIAILRHRLYDIDVVINRTLVYGVLTASLAAVYFGSVVSFQYVFRTVTGETSQLAIVVSTLLIAALFGPLRRRVQSSIDRRFYRRKYDAAKTLEGFSATLRDETDLRLLDAELLSVVRDTVRPEHASLWLREPGYGKGEAPQ